MVENFEVFRIPEFKGKCKKVTEENKSNFVLMCKFTSAKFHFYDLEKDDIICNHINLYDKKHIYYVEKKNIEKMLSENLMCQKCARLYSPE
jgi:hypothetical protein